MVTAYDVVSRLVGSKVTWERGAVQFSGTLLEISGTEKAAVLTIGSITASLFSQSVETNEPEILTMKVNTLIFNPLELSLHNRLIFQGDVIGQYRKIEIHESSPQPI